MSVIPHTPAGYDPTEASLQELSYESVLQMRVSWDHLYNANLLSDTEVELIRRYDKQSIETKRSILDQVPDAYAALFLRLVSQINKNERLRYALSLIYEILNDDDSRVHAFLRQQDPYSPFMRVLHTKNDTFISAMASRIVSLILFRCGVVPHQVVQELLRWCGEKLQAGRRQDISVALGALQIMLRKDEHRVIFYQEDGINRLGGIIRSPNQHTELLYQALYCLWLLSYNQNIASSFHESGVVARVAELLRNVPKEKVIRMALAILRNICNKGDSNQNNEQMIESELVRVLDNLGQKKWGDTDVVEDLEFLSESLEENIVRMSSFDIYKEEVMSGNLDWSPVHKSERFWRESIMKFEDNAFEVLGVLINLLKNSQNSLVLAVACHDIGEFIRFHPRGRNIVSGMGGKYVIMQMMQHQDPEVQKQALLATQKLLVVNWEFIR